MPWVKLHETGRTYRLTAQGEVSYVGIFESVVSPIDPSGRSQLWQLEVDGAPTMLGVTAQSEDSYVQTAQGFRFGGWYAIGDRDMLRYDLRFDDESGMQIASLPFMQNDPAEVLTADGASWSDPMFMQYVPPSSIEDPSFGPGNYSSTIWVWQGDGPEPDADQLNCNCDATYNRVTLGSMVSRVLTRMGYAAQLARLPPGVRAKAVDFIQEAQTLTAADFDEIGHERFFTWQLEQGVRRYGLDENVDVCTKLFQHLKISGVYLVRGTEWARLVRGINPLAYDGGVHETNPTNYEIRQCIELWPAPDSDAGELVILGKYQNLPLEQDEDYTTVDPQALFLRAVAMYKADKGHPDAGTYMQQYEQYIGNVNAGSHEDRRYIPPTRTERSCGDRLTRRMQPKIYGDGQ